VLGGAEIEERRGSCLFPGPARWALPCHSSFGGAEGQRAAATVEADKNDSLLFAKELNRDAAGATAVGTRADNRDRPKGTGDSPKSLRRSVPAGGVIGKGESIRSAFLRTPLGRDCVKKI
jgi:hypothetical protein